MHALASRVLTGDVASLARACRGVDDRLPGYRDVLRDLYPHTGRAWLLGVTGNPGAGKSTLTDRLVVELRLEHPRVGVIAVDPTSPFSGGALLGDRIRMQRHFEDPGVFIRSVATRGAMGGLSPSVLDIARVLDAWGAGVVVVETVGVGQDELDVTRSAHTTAVVVVPGLGDDVQANKAGILECADVFAVNKADRAGADATVRDLENMLALGSLSLVSPPAGPGHGAARGSRIAPSTAGVWVPPIVKTVASTGEGIVELLSRLREHRAWLGSTPEGQARLSERSREELVSSLREALWQDAMGQLGPEIQVWSERVEAREVDPYTACDRLIERARSRR